MQEPRAAQLLLRLGRACVVRPLATLTLLRSAVKRNCVQHVIKMYCDECIFKCKQQLGVCAPTFHGGQSMREM